MMIVVVLVVGLVIYMVAKNKQVRTLPVNKPTAEVILRERFANGEIDEETFTQMKETLNK